MSFIKDLIAWKARPDRAADYDMDDGHLGFETGAEAEAAEDLDEDWDEDWDDEDDLDAEDYAGDEDDEDADAEDPRATLAEAVSVPGPKAGGPARAPAAAAQAPEDSAEVDDILIRVAQRNAARASHPDTARIVRTQTPPKIWELNAGSGAAAAPAKSAEAPRARPEPSTPTGRVAPTTPHAAPHGTGAVQTDPRPRAVAQAAGPATQPVQPETAAEPPQGPALRPAGRVKTRLLGFHSAGAVPSDPFETEAIAPPAGSTKFPTGWVVVVEGPGRGTCFTLQGGVSQIGRGDGQAIRLDFGDQSISRNNHAAIAYDDEVGRFYLGHGGKLNLVRLNDRPVLSTEELATNDKIRIGETVLKFVALCGDGFTWAEEPGRGANAAAG